MTRRTVLHVDLDAFFVACELLRRPELRGLPVAVGGSHESHPGQPRDPGRSVVSAASYEARPFGVRSALPLASALRLCPELVVLPVDIAEYVSISKRVFAILADYTPLIEPGSLDEAYLDLSGTETLLGPAELVARSLQARLQDELGLPSSVGVASSKMMAKVASELRKPRGLVVVADGGEAAFLSPLGVERLPGLGPKTVARLELIGIRTLGALAEASSTLLEATLGPGAGVLQSRAKGLDQSPVVTPGTPKSLSREETYAEDVVARGELEARCAVLAAEVGRRLRSGALTAHTVTLKLRFAGFETLSRRRRLPEPTYADHLLREGALRLLGETWQEGRPVRLLGVGAEGLREARQLGLFEQGGDRGERLDLALDRLRERFGRSAIARGTGSLGAATDWNRDDLRRLRPD